MLKAIKSLFRSVINGLKNDPELKKLIRKHPRFFEWFKKRFDKKYRFGFYFTVGLSAIVLFILLFVGVIQDIVALDPLALADQRISNLLVLYRTPTMSAIMLFITYLGRWQFVALSVSLVSTILFLSNRKNDLLYLVMSVAGGQLLVTILKNLINRPRPMLVNAVVTESSPSFPSGHTFIVFSFYLLVLFMAWKLLERKWEKVTLLILGLLLVILIPFSRIYLGAHWPSDVLGSVYLGLAWLSGFVTLIILDDKFGKKNLGHPLLKGKIIWGLSAGFLLLILGYSVFYYKNNSYLKVAKSRTMKVAQSQLSYSELPDNLFANLPRTSEGLTGNAMEPINFIFIGPKESMDSAFRSANWVPTDPINISTTWKIAYSTLFDKPYATAPGTPSFWDFRPNNYSYEKPTSSVREREHIHIWTTPYSVNGQPLWLGTAHFDKSVKLTTNFIPTHEIDPFIDQERDSLKQQLFDTGKLSAVKEVKIVSPEVGKNLAGSVFTTDGNGYLITLK